MSALNLLPTLPFCSDLKRQIIEYQELTNQLRRIRPDLDEETIFKNVHELASADNRSALDHTRHCIRLAARAEPMPWEPS